VTTANLDDVNFHTLRHTFASWAVMRGVTVKELQELLGHATLAMTMRYTHLAPEHLRTAVSRLARTIHECTRRRAERRQRVRG
jgi:site-specific recombinase XerD